MLLHDHEPVVVVDLEHLGQKPHAYRVTLAQDAVYSYSNALPPWIECRRQNGSRRGHLGAITGASSWSSTTRRHERAIFAPIWELAFLDGVGSCVEDSGLGLIAGYAYSAPYEVVQGGSMMGRLDGRVA